MKINNLDFSIKKNSDLYKVWKCSMKNKHIAPLVDEKIENIRQQVEIPGFRKGKVDKAIVVEKYGVKAFYDVVNDLVVHVINEEIMQKEKYDLISRPDIKFQSPLDPKKDLDFHIYFFVKPDFSNFEFSKVSINTNVVKLSDTEFNKEVKSYLAKNSDFIETSDLNYFIKNGDKVNLSFDGYLTNQEKPIEGGKADSYDLVIGSKSFIDTFEEQILGHKINDEFVVNVFFPSEYPQNKALENQPAYFNVKINKIHESVPAELNESFVTKNGFENVEKFKQSFKEEISKGYINFEKLRLKSEIFKSVVKKADIEVPDEVVDGEIKFRIDKHKETLEENEKFEEKEFIKENKEKVRNNLEVYYVIQAVAKKKDIAITDNEIKGYLIRYAINSGVENVQAFLKGIESDESKITQIKSNILEDKVYDCLFDEVTKKNKEISKEEFDKIINQFYEAKRSKN